MVTVTNLKPQQILAELNKKAIETIIELFESGDYEAITETGLSIKTIERIRNLRANELAKISHHRKPIVEYIWNDSEANHLLDTIQRFSSTDVLVDQLIKLKAPINLIVELADWSRNEVLIRRKLFGVGDMPRGRIEKLPDKEEIKIENVWFSQRDKGYLQRCLMIYELTGITLDLAWSTIRECIQSERVSKKASVLKASC